MRALLSVATIVLLGGAAACHPGPVVGGGQQSVGGTISGNVTASGAVAISGRKVTIVETTTNERYETTTSADGGYTMKVPEGTYRIELELRPGESLSRQPDPTRINNGDLDSGRNFVVTVAPPGR